MDVVALRVLARSNLGERFILLPPQSRYRGKCRAIGEATGSHLRGVSFGDDRFSDPIEGRPRAIRSPPRKTEHALHVTNPARVRIGRAARDREPRGLWSISIDHELNDAPLLACQNERFVDRGVIDRTVGA